LNRNRQRGLLQKLLSREISHKGNQQFKKKDCDEKFKNFHVQAAFDTIADSSIKARFHSQKRSKIVEITAAESLTFVLTQSGLCTVLDRDHNRRLGWLNNSPEEVIRSLFYNKFNHSLVTVSVFRADNFNALKCRTTPLQYIARGKFDAGYVLFETESLRWPGFVEFDDVNGKVLTYSAIDKYYKVWDLTNYTLMYSFADEDIHEIKISPGIMLLVYNRTASHIPMKILSIETGEVLKSFQHLVQRNKRVDFIEQFNEKLLIKQQNVNLQIVDINNSSIIEVNQSIFGSPSAFIFLYENQLFLTFRDRNVAVWNFKGELVTKFEDHLLWNAEYNTNNIFITGHQDVIISYCKSASFHQGAIHVSDILTGECLAKISNNDRSGWYNPLEDITALFYNEERNEIYTGNKDGFVRVWTN